MADMQKVVEELAKKALERDKDERVEIIIRVTSALFDKAAAYTNLIIIAGFAGFFAVWSSMKVYLSPLEMFTSAFCVTVSLSVFIFWEVFGMLVRSRTLKELLKVLNTPAAEFQGALAKQQKTEQLRNIWVFRIWAVALFFTIAPALVAAGVLIFSFGRQLWAAF